MLAHHGDPVGGVQHLEDAGLQHGVFHVLQQFLGAGVLFPDPGELSLAVDLLEPDVLVNGFRGRPLGGAVAAGRPGAGGGAASLVVIFPSKQHQRASSKSRHRPSEPRQVRRAGPGCGPVADTLDAVGISQSIRTAVIGAGPRGTSVLERLLANWVPSRPDATLHIDVIDPYPAGPGHVWQPGQSRLYLMNTQSFYPTVIPEDPDLAPPLAGHTSTAGVNCSGTCRTPPYRQERAELSGLGSADFPSRALYGRYLRSTLEGLLSRLPAGAMVDFHDTTATSVRHAAATGPEGDGGRVRFDVGLDDGAVLTVDSVVLALGHLGSRSDPEQRELQAAESNSGCCTCPGGPGRGRLVGGAGRQAGAGARHGPELL